MRVKNIPTVVITHWVHDDVLQLLGKYCCVIPNTTSETLSHEEVLKRTCTADGLMVFMPDQIDEKFLDQCPCLKVIGAALKGYDNFDVEACRQRGIQFSIVPELLTEPAAELAIGLLLGIGRNILPGDYQVRNGQFHGWRPVLYGKGLSGSTIGIVGMGAIGRAVAQRLMGFNCRLVYSDPQPLEHGVDIDNDLTCLPLYELLAISDFVLLTLPLTPQTRHVINSTALAGIKTGAYLVNIGRGSVVDEAAVSAALKCGLLAGYAADVFEFEDWALADRPPGVHPELLLDTGKTLFTPHLGSAVDDVRKKIALEAAHAILSGLNITIL